MRRILLRFPSLFARNSVYSSANFRWNYYPWLVPLVGAPTRSRLVFFSSESDSSRKSGGGNLPGPISSRDNDDVSNEELKRRIESFLDGGDEEALPTIFEAILKRKLSRKHEESDNELMEELLEKHPVDVEDKGDEVDSDSEIDGSEDASDSDADSN